MGRVSLIFNEKECMGCHACEVACKQEHGLKAGPKIIKVLERAPFFRPLFCHHCEDAPCVKACPESAIKTDPLTGVVLHDLEKCTGCNAVEGKSGLEKQETSSCRVGCPAHINVQAFVSLAMKGRFAEALQIIKEASPFPSICGRVCHHPCETACERKQIDEAVGINSIERYIADLDLQSPQRYRPEIKERKEEKVAVVGSGPAGLSCAYYLARDGYQVTVFEKDERAGGMLTMGIPAYRLPHDIVEAEIDLLARMGVTIKTGVEIGKDKTLDQLREEGFRAFFIAVGAQKSLRLGVEGEDLENVYDGLTFLRQVNLGRKIGLGKHVAVIGGGNVALDGVRSARRLGADNAFILYRRGKEEMPARPGELEECEEEGIVIHTLTQPVRILGENGKVTAVECLKTRLVEADETGRRKFVLIPGSEFVIKVDAIILALGQEPDWSALDPVSIGSLNEGGTIKVDPLTLQSEKGDIFAGGDVVRGPSSVIEAIADGRQAALSIARYLKGQNLRLGRDMELAAITNPQKDKYDPSGRLEIPKLEPLIRLTNFAEIVQGLDQAMVVGEAKRCITCGASCIQACPYQVMQFNEENKKAVKCDLCVVKRGKKETPACFAVCPTRCISWGDPKELPEVVVL